ncbi:MAG: hypothetical protein AAF628_03190 [Planctomycetota bacterium]
MSRRTVPIFVLVGIVAMAMTPRARAQAEDLAIVNCNLIPMDGNRVIADATVVVSGGRIRSVGAAADLRIPEGTRVIEADGQWLLPGLTDMHVHFGHASECLLYLRFGVTAVCNLGGDGLDLFSGDRLRVLDLRRRILDGELRGPDIYSAGSALDGDPPTGPFQTPVADATAGAQMVRQQHAAGFDYIKVYDALPPATHAAILRAAREVGMTVFGHVPEALGVEATLRSGQTVIAHAEEYFGAYDTTAVSEADTPRRLARLTRQSRAVVIPNTAFIRNVLRQLDDLQAMLDRPEVRFIAPSVRRLWEPRYNYLVRRPDPDAFAQQMKDKYAFVHVLTKALHDEGVLLLAGSDASLPTLIPGLSLHEELRDLVVAGLTPYEALRTATTNVQTFLRRHPPQRAEADELGTLQVGGRANLLLLEKNPLESLTHLDGVVGVVVRGRYYDREELDAALAEIADSFAR